LEELQNQRFQHQKAILHDFFVDGVKHYFEKLALDAMQKYGFIKNKFERKLLKVIKKTEKLPHKNDDLDNDANYFNVVKKLEYIMLSMMSVPAKAPLFFLKYDELMHKLYDETQLLQQIAQIKEARKNGVLFRNSELKTELLQRSFEYDLITIQNHDLSMQPIKLFDAGLDAANHKITKLPKATVKFFDNHLGVFSSAVDAATFAPPTVQHQRYSLFGASSLTQDSASSESNTNFYHHSK